jgi:two-component system C4-dicarboxylate transport response regulator DctD
MVLTGPHGSGKSHAARLIHDLSARRARPFVTVDAGVLAHEDAELLLFGRDPGAGISGVGLSRTGLVERANGGTLLLDEIAAASTVLTARLLSLVETRQVLPIGGASARRLNLRIIIARLGDDGAQRDPLWHRLGAVQIAFPALGERREDGGERRAGFHPRQVGHRRTLHAEHQIGAADGGAAIANACAGFGIGGIGNIGMGTGAGFHRNAGAKADQFLYGFRRRCDARLGVGSFTQHGNFHQ